ncbi:MAG: hypothetical protein AABX88_00685 [Nanoarchaeota archaeon]
MKTEIVKENFANPREKARDRNYSNFPKEPTYHTKNKTCFFKELK